MVMGWVTGDSSLPLKKAGPISQAAIFFEEPINDGQSPIKI